MNLQLYLKKYAVWLCQTRERKAFVKNLWRKIVLDGWTRVCNTLVVRGNPNTRGANMYVVYFTGEYEFDENGYNVPKTRRYKTLEGAQRAANKFYERTRCIATIIKED